MDKFLNFIQTIPNNLLGYWETSSIQKKSFFVAGFIASIALLTALFSFNKNDNLQNLYVNLAQDDLSSISNFLVKNDYQDFKIYDKTIKVPTQDIDRIRVMLSQEGLPHKGIVGWEQFDKDNFTRTGFEQEIQKLRAIQGELSRTISSISGITSARVHIVIPKSSLFIRKDKKTTAAIHIKTKRSFELSERQINGILHLVSNSVEGLNTDSISVIGANGKLLSNGRSNNSLFQKSQEILEYKKRIEEDLQARITSIVGRIVGTDRVEANVDADIDFTREEQTISDVDPDDSVVISKNSSGYTSEGHGLSAIGIPGAKSNIPGEEEKASFPNIKRGTSRENEIVNYEFSKKISRKTLATGTLKRLTISAIVDGKQEYALDGTIPEFIPLSSEELKKIEEIIKNSVGFKEGRDSLTVQNMMFRISPTQVMEIKTEKTASKEYLTKLAKSGVLAILIIFFFTFIIRPYMRWLTYDPDRKGKEIIVEELDTRPQKEVKQRVETHDEVPFEKLSKKEQVLFLARNEPKRTTEAIRLLLNTPQQGR